MILGAILNKYCTNYLILFLTFQPSFLRGSAKIATSISTQVYISVFYGTFCAHAWKGAHSTLLAVGRQCCDQTVTCVRCARLLYGITYTCVCIGFSVFFLLNRECRVRFCNDFAVSFTFLIFQTISLRNTCVLYYILNLRYFACRAVDMSALGAQVNEEIKEERHTRFVFSRLRFSSPFCSFPHDTYAVYSARWK